MADDLKLSVVSDINKQANICEYKSNRFIDNWIICHENSELSVWEIQKSFKMSE